MSNSARHGFWMAKALELAEKGRCGTSPNPMVGACVVKNKKLIASGYHQRYGAEHAEVIALKKAGHRAKGAVLYITLEPCASWGKTPPCVDAILKSGIRKVVVGAIDPNPENSRKGIAALRREGIEVISGILQENVTAQNDFFFKTMKTRLPFVTLKMAQTLDGKIATASGHSRWITSPPARKFVHRLRWEQDAVLIGAGTLRKDNPYLSPRMPGKNSEKPWRIALDPQFEISPRARIFKGPQTTVIAVSEKTARSKKFQRKQIRGCVILPVRETQGGRLDLKELLGKLAGLGIAKLLVEGGGELAWSLIRQGLVDKFYWLVAPKFLGGRLAKTSVEGEGFLHANQALNCKITKTSFLGPDLLIEGKLKN